MRRIYATGGGSVNPCSPDNLTTETEEDAVRQWAEVGFVPDERVYEPKTAVPKRRYLVIRMLKKQGSRFADGSDRKPSGI